MLSCGLSQEQKVDRAIKEANFFLTHDECSKAKKTLDDVGYQSKNAPYIKLYANSLACLAGYNELDDLFGGNMTAISATAGGFLTSLAAFNTSQEETTAESASFTYLIQAIEVILGSGSSTQPSAANREAKFGTRHGADLNMQAI